MTIEIDMESTGLESAGSVLAALRDLKGAITITADTRQNGKSNAEVLEELADLGYDYAEFTAREIGEISKVYIEDLETRLGVELAKTSGKIDPKIKSKALTAAMEKPGEIAADKIEAGGSVKTGQLRDNMRDPKNIKVAKGYTERPIT